MNSPHSRKRGTLADSDVRAEPILARWARLVYRHPVRALALPLVVFLGSGLLLLGGQVLSPDLSVSGQSRTADDLIREQVPELGGSSFQVVFQSASLTATDPTFRSAVAGALAPVRDDPRVVRVATPYDTGAPSGASGISRSGDAAFVTVFLADSFTDATVYYPELRDRIRSDALTVRATGELAVNQNLSTSLDADLKRAESISLPGSLIVLLVVFGTVVAALLPLGIGAVAVLSGVGGVMALAGIAAVSDLAPSLVSLLGLGLAIDYSLFVVSRFREELAAGSDTEDALATALARVGRSIVLSGIAVVAGLAGLLFYQGTFLPLLGATAMLVVVLAVFYALTLLPAVLTLLGARVNRLRVRRLGAAGPGRFWYGLAHGVMRRPWLLLPAIGLLAVAVVPFLHLRLETSELNVLPGNTEAQRAQHVLTAEFPGHDREHLTVVVRRPADVAVATRAIESDPGVERVDPAATGADIAVLDVVSRYPPRSDDARDLVGRIRSLPVAHGRLLVTGPAAVARDLVERIRHSTPYALTFVVLAVYLILLFGLRSVLLPAKAVLLTLLSITASFGALVWVFQDGHLTRVLDFTPAGIDPAVPVLLFCLVFGLSMDYEVLLLSRIQEAYLTRRDNADAVAAGLERSGRLITGAALIMVVVFGSFAVGDVLLIKALGLGLALAVAVDATIVRCVAVPALMRLLGRANWWAPGPLRHPSLRPPK